ncbi:MAG: hypothetical protein WBV84_10015 [Nitrososphaeraceae archaeon]
MTIEFFKTSASRIELRCSSSRCNGLVGWWDEPTRTKKIFSFMRASSEEECLAMR